MAKSKMLAGGEDDPAKPVVNAPPTGHEPMAMPPWLARITGGQRRRGSFSTDYSSTLMEPPENMHDEDYNSPETTRSSFLRLSLIHI